MGLASLPETSRRAVARSLVPRSPFAVGPQASAVGSSRLDGGTWRSRTSTLRLSEGWLPFRVLPGRLAAARRLAAPSLRFWPLQRFRRREPTHPGFASSRFGSGFRVSHPRAALRLPQPSDPLGSVTLLGFPLRGFSLSTEPQRLSASVALLPLSARLADPKVVESVRTRLQGLAPRESPSRSNGV